MIPFPRPTWFRFLCDYLRLCVLVLLLVVLVMGVPLALIISWLVAK